MAAYTIIYDSRRFVRSDSTDTTVLLPVAAGGTNANLSATGGANQFVKQSTVGGTFTVGAIGAGDVPDAALTSNVALLNRDAQVFTGTYNRFTQVGVGGAPTSGFIIHAQGNGAIQTRVETTDNTTTSLATMSSVSGATTLNVNNHAAARVVVRYGITLGGWIEIGAANNTGTNNGLIMGTQGAVPCVIGTNNLERLRIDGNGNVSLGTAALATNATDGFLNVDSCAGTPSGVPTAFTGRVPVVHDTTGNNEWQYNGGWRLAGFDVAQTLQAPALNETLTAGYSAVVNRSLTIASGKKYTIGSGARMRIL